MRISSGLDTRTWVVRIGHIVDAPDRGRPTRAPPRGASGPGRPGFASHRKRAASAGIVRAASGAVTCVQRFGGSLNLNVHFHTIVLDGVFVREPDGHLAVASCESRADAFRSRSTESRFSCAQVVRFSLSNTTGGLWPCAVDSYGRPEALLEVDQAHATEYARLGEWLTNVAASLSSGPTAR